MTTTVLVTGATGFLGKQVLNTLTQDSSLQLIAACRSPQKLPPSFRGEVRQGDLRDANYRQSLVQGVDVLCHIGTWAAMWGHKNEEKSHFYAPCIDLIEQAQKHGVQRFIMTSTIAIADKKHAPPLKDNSATVKTGYWPHLDALIDVDAYMRAHASRGMQMVTLRLGHFVGAGNTLGLVPVLVPRLKTRLVPWLAGGRKRMPLITAEDLGEAYLKTVVANNLKPYESFNICGAEFPTSREVLEHIHQQTGLPLPWFSVPYWLGYAFGASMESLYPLLPGKAPFLTRSIVHLAEEWLADTRYAQQKLGFTPQGNWRLALNEALASLKTQGYPWPALAQSIQPGQESL